MEKKRVLIITQEMKPYLGHTDISDITRQLSQYIQEDGMDIRVLMPRFGNINERRHRLHEVVRLSGINISVGEDDYPLVIKVGSLPGTRMQVYFLDNEDLFKRNGDIFDAKKKTFYKDNAERMAFFCKGAMEIVKKFGWAPDIIHCHGWMTGLIPVYVKKAYKDEPVFKDAKIVYSVYKENIFNQLNDGLEKMATLNGSVKPKELAIFKEASFVNINQGAINYSDAIVAGEEISKDMEGVVEKATMPVVKHNSEEEDKFLSYTQLYNSLAS